MKVITDRKRIEEILDRGIVTTILPEREEFINALTSGRRLKLYIGADPTSDSLHLSHAKNYMLLEEFRQLGHEVIILVGDFTAQIGDPTDRQATRVQLTEKQVKNNVKGWVAQIKPLLNFKDKKNPPKIVYNSKWLNKLSFSDVLSLTSNFTVQQMIERDMFTKRWEANVPIYLHEFLYPVMQGYDSVALNIDVELCGTDQTFNALAGRTLVKRLRGKDKFVLVVNLMENPKTGELMSKSRGTGVFLSSSPEKIYEGIMNQPDEMTEVLFINCTRIPLTHKKEILSLDPKEAKAQVAFEIVKKICGEKKAIVAKQSFDRKSKGETTLTDYEVVVVSPDILSRGIVPTLVQIGVARSNSEAGQLVKQGQVRINDQVIKDLKRKIQKEDTLKVGKHKLYRLR